MKRSFIFFALLLSFVRVPAQDKLVIYYADAASNPPEIAVNLIHIEAHVSFKPEENRVSGKTIFTFLAINTITDSIIFSTPGFTIKSVELGQKVLIPVPWHLTGSNLVIVPGQGSLKYHEEYKVLIVYEAQPLRGSIYFIGWRPEEKGKRKVIWAHRPNGWLPYLDARITMDMHYTFDGKYKVFANGERISVKDNPDKTKTWNYRMNMNHPFFSTSVVIGDYDYKSEKTKGNIPLEYWYYSGDEDKVSATYQFSPEMMDFFEKELNFRYPYPVYRQAPVIDYMYGAMETTTATVFGDFLLIDPHAYWQRNYINTNAHELAHQWFGNYICHFVNQDVWLTESFGTYYAKIFEKNQFGKDHYQNIMNDEYNIVMQASKTNNYPVRSSKSGVARIYQKGSLVLGMLRKVMGDEEFRFSVKSYLKDHPYKNALQEDFFRAVYEATGKSYMWFFDEWILRGGEPHYKVEFSEKDDTSANRSTYIHVWQIHETNELIGYFKMPVEIAVFYKDGTSAVTTKWIENSFHELTIPNSGKKQIDYVIFDKGREILKKLSFKRTFNQLASQALKAENMIDRYDALIAVREFSLSIKKELLLKCYSKESFHLTKTEIIYQLSSDRTDVSVLLFGQALADSDAVVRKAVLLNVVPVPGSLKKEFESSLNDFSYLNQELALQNLCLSFPQDIERYLSSTEKLRGWRGLNIRMRWLQIAISSGKKEFLPELIEYTSPKFEFETRINAFNILKGIQYTDSTTFSNAQQGSDHWNNKLSSSAMEYLKYFSQKQR